MKPLHRATLLLPALYAAAFAGDPPRRVLFVGNSYTARSRKHIRKTVASLGLKTELAFITPGGCTLARHAKNEETVAKIVSGGWDVVVLQEQSQIPSFPPAQTARMMYPAARRLDKHIGKAGAQTVFFLTWGRDKGDRRNRADDTFEKMQQRLTRGYSRIARELDAAVAPCGPAWAAARDKHELYAPDGSHPAIAGGYLNACVFAAVVFGRDPAAITYTGGLDPAAARELRTIAAQAVRRWRTAWKKNTPPSKEPARRP